MSAFKHGPKPVVGLIGGIGAGKSTAAKCFAVRAGQVIDADVLGHEALRQPEVIESLVRRWGAHVHRPDGSLDRREIAKIVFADAAEREALESTVFPYIAGRTRELIAAAQANPGVAFVVLDAAVLLEAGWGGLVDELVFVDAPRDLRVARLRDRSGWSEADLTAREAAQWPADEKMLRAGAVLVNDSGAAALQEQVDDLLARWRLTRGPEKRP
jgi:dephospho-CoA kinase